MAGPAGGNDRPTPSLIKILRGTTNTVRSTRKQKRVEDLMKEHGEEAQRLVDELLEKAGQEAKKGNDTASVTVTSFELKEAIVMVLTDRGLNHFVKQHGRFNRQDKIRVFRIELNWG